MLSKCVRRIFWRKKNGSNFYQRCLSHRLFVHENQFARLISFFDAKKSDEFKNILERDWISDVITEELWTVQLR